MLSYRSLLKKATSLPDVCLVAEALEAILKNPFRVVKVLMHSLLGLRGIFKESHLTIISFQF